MAIAELVMPKMGESIMEATILRWHKKVGDPVNQDETVLDIATDKVDSEIPSTVSGVITELLYNVNDVVPVGAVIAKIKISESQPVTNEPVPPPAHTPSPMTQYTPPVVPQPIAAAEHQVPYIPQAPAAARPAVNNNRFFSPLVLNIANSEGLSLSELERVPGTGADGRVSKKDILLYIADKKAGNVSPFVPQPTYGQQSPAYHTQPEPAYESHQAEPAVLPVPPADTNIATPPAYTPPPAEKAGVTQTHQPVFIPSQPVFIPPVEEAETVYYKHPIQENKVYHQAVPAEAPAPVYNAPSQPKVADKQAAQEHIPYYQSEQAAPIPSQSSTNNFQATVFEVKPQETGGLYQETIVKSGTEIIEMDRMRKLIAKHMVESKHTSAHVTSFAEADVTNMVTWRNRIKHDFEQKAGTKITFTPMFIECLIKVMKRFPIINSSVIGDTIAIKSALNIGMATALPDNNLIVPVIKHAEEMGLVALAKSVNTLADNARHNKLKPEDIQEGTFTFTNVGTFGSLMGTPIINQPQVAILAVGVIKKRPVVIETEAGDFIGIRHMMYLSLSYDHRIIDGSVGSSFLAAVAKEFENWDVNRELKLVVKEQYVD